MPMSGSSQSASLPSVFIQVFYHIAYQAQGVVLWCAIHTTVANTLPVRYHTAMPIVPEGVFLVDKPVGISSFDVVRRFRRVRGVRKMGHAGTLDPLASGLMIVAEGPATKLLSRFLKLPKTYEAEICIGESSTTADKEGEVTDRLEVRDLKEEDVCNTLSEMVGMLALPVPVYSAIKRGGEALYKKARRGETVEAPIKSMEVRDVVFVSMEARDGLCVVRARFDVGSGTYVRSLAVELGRRLGYPARLQNLRRTRVGEWRIEDAQSVPE